MGGSGLMNIKKTIAIIIICMAGATAAKAQKTSADFSAGGSVIVGNDTRTCDGTLEGAMRYNSGSMEVCDGTAWAAPGGASGLCTAPTLCPNVGDVCDDSNVGTTNDPIFAGCANYGGTYEPLFVSDDNQSLSSAWKTSSGVNDIATDSIDDGKLNVAQITVSTTFPAFKDCDDLTDGGFSDWYLPARAEVDVLRQSSAVINLSAVGNISGSYSTSSEFGSSQRWAVAIPSGTVSTTSKTGGGQVRCVRRD